MKSNFFKTHFALILFHLCFLILFLTNFPFGKWFLGWDSLNPELNFGINFTRSFSAFWQENYGLGTLGGHGFAATLPHTMITYLLSWVFPQQAIRPLFTMLCLYLGGLGMYMLIHVLLKKLIKTTPFTNLEERHTNLLIPFTALLAALFYILNFGTVQIFYVQLETFIGHFAALPWLFWITIQFLQNRSKKTLILFVIINFFATLQGFIPSLFVAYMSGLFLFLIIYLSLHKFETQLIRTSLLLLFLTGCINAYWLLPLVYYTLTQNSIFLSSYNNLISTPHFIDINRKYGDLKDVSLIRGYLWDSYELGGYVLQPWIDHQQNAVVTGIGYVFFATILGGIVSSLFWIKEKLVKALTGIFFFFFISIGTSLPILTTITNILQAISPTYQQAFRTAFTKFSIGLSFSYSIFLAVGIITISYFLYQKRKKLSLLLLPTIIGIGGLLVFSLPAFQGHMLYKKLLLDLPTPYKQVVSYFKTQPNGRIADFPQECPEGWYSYNWGYFGSGFYWYGVKQPFMSRSFDVWSNRNENYYWEISRAIQTEDYHQVDSIFQKYDISWVLYDPNELYCQNQKDVILQEKLISYLKTSPQYHMEASLSDGHISPIIIFKRLSSKSQSFVSFADALPNAGPIYNWNDQDTVASTLGLYRTDEKQPYTLFYPFRSLFTKRKAEEKEFQMTRNPSSITLSTTLPNTQNQSTLTFPALLDVEKTIPVTLQLRNDGSVYLTFDTPHVSIDHQTVNPLLEPTLIGEIPPAQTKPTLRINGEVVSFSDKKIAQGVFSTTQTNSITITSPTGTLLFNWNTQTTPNLAPSLYASTAASLQPDGKMLEITIPLIADNTRLGSTTILGYDETITPDPCYEPVPTNKNRFEMQAGSTTPFIRLISQESSQCLNLHFPKLDTDSGYLLEIEARSIQGNHPFFTVYNKEKTAYQDESILTTPNFSTFSYIIPPTFKDELGYDLQIRNVSESTTISTNDFAMVNLWSIPYNYLKTITLTSDASFLQSTLAAPNTFVVTHPTETYYHVNYSQTDASHVLLLSQTYNSAWKAYVIPSECTTQTVGCVFMKAFPFFFGKELKTHNLTNNWENSWDVPTTTNKHVSMIIIFLPQYLQYFGYLLLVLTTISVVALSRSYTSGSKLDK
jgi:hypothetical protein